MKTSFAYFMAIFIGPIIGILIMMQLLPPKRQYSVLRVLLETITAGFLSICFAKFIFVMSDVYYDPSVVLFIGIFFLLNFVIGYFIKNRSYEIAKMKLLGGIGCLFGVIIGGILFR